MLTVEATAPDLRALSDDELAGLYGAGDDDTMAAVLAEAARRDRADRARQARQAVESAWYDAAFAAYMAAEDACRGRMFSADGMQRGPADAFGLWRLPERQALKFASEELRLHWLEHPRLSFAEYKRQLAAGKRQARDERDLASGATGSRKRQPAEPEQPWERVPGGAVRPASVPVGSLTVAAWTAMSPAGTVTLHPSRERARRWLAPAPGPRPAPSPQPVTAPGAAVRYGAALAALSTQVDSLTARALAARGEITKGGSR
jgi:hypothetical protein